jgi:predicted TIM-barrel fold metal-dependent hydrolase
VMGLDWPHPGHQPKPPMPDDGFLLDLFPQWVPDPAIQKQILVDSAAELYRF